MKYVVYDEQENKTLKQSTIDISSVKTSCALWYLSLKNK